MAPNVYSERLMHHSVAGIWYYNVPAYKRVIITKCHVFTDTAVTGVKGWQLAVAGIWATGFLIPAGSTGGWNDIRLVAYAGEQVAWQLYGPYIQGHLSGYVFDDPGRSGAVTRPTPPNWLEGAHQPAPDPVQLPWLDAD